MLIDWFTVVAQVINFLILVWLLKRFLYKPILDTIDERERKVVEQLADADARMSEAQKERAEYMHKKQELEQHRAESLDRAEREAEVERLRLLDEARKEYDEKRIKFGENIKHEEAHLIQALSSHTRKEVFAIARKTLADLADVGLERSMVDVFIRRVRSLGGEEKAQLAADFRSSPVPVLIRAETDLQPDQKMVVEQALEDILGAKPEWRYETMPGLIGGIEVTISGKKIAWSIREYLSSLESDIHEILKMQPADDAGEDQSRETYQLNVENMVGQQRTGTAEYGS